MLAFGWLDTGLLVRLQLGCVCKRRGEMLRGLLQKTLYWVWKPEKSSCGLGVSSPCSPGLTTQLLAAVGAQDAHTS